MIIAGYCIASCELCVATVTSKGRLYAASLFMARAALFKVLGPVMCLGQPISVWYASRILAEESKTYDLCLTSIWEASRVLTDEEEDFTSEPVLRIIIPNSAVHVSNQSCKHWKQSLRNFMTPMMSDCQMKLCMSWWATNKWPSLSWATPNHRFVFVRV